MEACASAHYWARRLIGLGYDVVLLPPQYVRSYVRRDKTDRTDCEAILEALRCGGIHPVSVKSEAQQAILALHGVRSQWMGTRTARINAMRALLQEFGVIAPQGSQRFLRELPHPAGGEAGAGSSCGAAAAGGALEGGATPRAAGGSGAGRAAKAHAGRSPCSTGAGI